VGWREIGSLDELDPADPVASVSVAVNAVGNIAGSTAPGTPDTRAVVWIAGQRTQLPGLNDGRSGAFAITDAGVVGGYAADASDRQRPVLWMPSSAPPPAALSRPLAATPVGAPSASPPSTARSVVWDGIDVTVELRENSALHVTERNRIDFIGGPFRSGYREIPLAAIEDVDQITVGEVDGGIQAYRYVSSSEFSADNPNTYTYRVTGPTLRIDWSFPPTTSQSRTFQLDYDALGALRVYDDVETPYQQISWIGVDDDITENARVNNATLRFVLPQPVDPGRTVIQGPGSQQPEEHTTDGKTWVRTASNLGPGETLEASLQFPPLVEATKPSWQTASDRAERQQAERDTRVTPAPQGTPTASASPVVSSAAAPGASPVAMPSSIPPCTEVIEDDFYGKTRDLLADCTTDRPIFVPEEWVFDGGGHTIFAIDPDDGRLTGGVIMITGASGTVRHVTIDGSRLTAGCVVDRGQTALTGVVVRGASGEVSGVTVRNLARPLPAAAAPPTNPPESVSESCGTGIAVLGREANVTVIENVIENVGYVGVLVEVGQASISHTTIDRAADTGILALLGAHVRISPGNQIRNGFIGIQLEGEGTGGRVAGTTIERMALMGVAIIGGAQASIANNSIADTAVNGIAIEGETTEATIENNQLDDPGEVGIKGLQASVEVRGNRVSGGDFGIGIGDGGTAQVFGNTLNRPQNTGIYVLHEGTSATIAGNTVADAASDGIWVEQAARATITGNTVTDATSTGITAVAGATVTIAGENVVRGGERGIEVAGAGTTATVTGNRVEGTGVVGITINRGAAARDVSGNTVAGAQFGIVFEGESTRGTIADNLLEDTGQDGIVVQLGAEASATGNTVTRVGNTGILVASGAVADITGNIIGVEGIGIGVRDEATHALVINNSLSMIDSELSDEGISISEGASVRIEENTITGGDVGIAGADPGSTAVIERNTVDDVWDAGIHIRDGASAEIIHNDVTKGYRWGILVMGQGTTASVTNNALADIRDSSIQFGQGAQGTISGNTLTAVTNTGIRIIDANTKVTVTRNTVRGARAIGIEVRAPEVTITDNTIAGSGSAGIQLGPDTVVVVTENTVSGPGEQDIDRDGPYGIQVFRGVSGTISTNQVTGHGNLNPQYVACGIVIDADAPGVGVMDNYFPESGNEVDLCDGRVAAPDVKPVAAATPLAVTSPTPAPISIPATPSSPNTPRPVTTMNGVELIRLVDIKGVMACGTAGCPLHLVIDPAVPGRQVIVVRLTDLDGSPLPLEAAPTIEITWTPLTSATVAAEAGPFSTVLMPDAAGSTQTGEVTLSESGWWEASVAVTPADADAPWTISTFWLVLPDSTATSSGPEAATDPEAHALFARGLAILTSLQSLGYQTSLNDGKGVYASWDTDVRAATAEQPAASVTWKNDTDGRRTGEMIVGDRRWVTVPGKGWVAAKPVPFTPPPAWDQLYTGATGFQFGPIQQLGRDEESFQVVTFWQPAEASPSGEPAWYVWWVGRDSGRLRREAVVSTDLYQVRSFSRFDEPVRIDPPPAPAPSTATPEPMLSTAATPTLPADGGPSATPPASTAGESGSVETPEASACAAAWQDNSATATRTLIADCTTEVPIELPNGWTFDGQGHTIRLVDPPGRFHGGVIKRRIRYTAQHHRQVLVAAAAADGRSDGQLTR
jgi:hypothetical protein